MRHIWLLLLLCSIASAEPRQLWLYYSTNLQVDDNVTKLEPIWRRASAAGYTHILLADSKFARLGKLEGMEKRYFANVDRVKKLASDLKLQIVPALFHIGYSNSMLYHDPNLAEGLPVKDQLFIVTGGIARSQSDPPIALTKPSWKDDNVHLEGAAATLKDPGGNARLVYKLRVTPWRCYHVSVKIKANNFTTPPEIKALAGDRVLQWQSLGAKKTQDWTDHHVVFNSLENNEINLYFGVWGGGKGTLQWKDWKIEESPLVNILRRDGAPLVVKNEDGTTLIEGKDFQPLTDPKMGRIPWPGEYHSWHEPPTFRTHLPDNMRLRISWYHPAIIYDGQVMICPSEPRTLELLRDEAQRLRAAFNSKGYMMSHDEIRCLNWDQSCLARALTPGQILAENVRSAIGILKGADVYAWSDMFDPHHNAVPGPYYLVNGDLRQSWQGLDRNVIIMNWNSAKAKESLKFFADRGHRQIIAGYYDAPVNNIKRWLDASRDNPSVIGIMYTTWKNRYDDLEAFAKLYISPTNNTD